MKRKTLINMIVLLVSLTISVSVFVAQTNTRPKPAANTGDIKVRYRTTMSGAGDGQPNESVTMIKGPRERSESHYGYGYSSINITQCDLKRNIQVSDTAKKYIITPMESDDTSATTTSAPAPKAPAGPSRRGGVVTYTTSAIDTGERKEMFGFTARHVKSTTVIESSPDACNQSNQRIETDGWYIDLNVGLECHLDRPPTPPPSAMPRSNCKDQTRFRREGTARKGFPLIETMKMNSQGGMSFSITKEVIELTRQPLDSALFDVPAGYTEAASSQELYGMPSMASMMGQAGQGTSPNTESPSMTRPTSTREPGAILIGVVQLNNKSGKAVSPDALRSRLIEQIESAGLAAVGLNASTPSEADVEAKAKQCDFILYTDIAALKGSKIGGMFGRVTGVGGAGTTEAKIEFRLFAVGESSPRLQSSSSAKEEGEEASAGTAIDTEARMVVAEARKKRN
jgi:hypothetical protein